MISLSIYNNGDLQRDFTYIDDIVGGVIRVQDSIPEMNSKWTVEVGSTISSLALYSVHNIGNG